MENSKGEARRLLFIVHNYSFDSSNLPFLVVDIIVFSHKEVVKPTNTELLYAGVIADLAGGRCRTGQGRSAFSAVVIGALLGWSMASRARAQVSLALPETPASALAPSNASGTSASSAGATANTPVKLQTVTVTADLDSAREEIAPSLGAVTYKIGPDQIQTMGQGESSSFQQVLLQAPGVVQEEFGEIHVRGDHGDVQYRVNGVLLPESLNGFGQEVDTHLIQSVTLITGTMPAQFGDRTAGIIDVTTKTGSQLGGAEFSFYGGSYDTINSCLQLGGVLGNTEYFVAVSYLHDDHGIDNTTTDPNPLHDLTDQERFFGYFSHGIDQTSRFTVLLSSSDANFQIPDTAGVAPIYQLADNASG